MNTKGGENVDMQIGRVTHYYDKIQVAVIEITNKPLKVGETVCFSGHDKEFIQKITSMQKEYKNVTIAKNRETVGIKVDKPVKSGDILLKVKE